MGTGRISINNAGRYGSGGSNDFFTLPDDGDRAVVTFLYDDPDGADIDYYLVHEVEIDGKRRYVNCNAVDGDRVNPENCPLCENGYPRIEKLFLQLYNHETGKVETWDRGRSYVPKIVTYINKYGSLVQQPFELIRSGRKGDTNTTYEFLIEEKEPDATLDDFDEKMDLLGSLIVKADVNDMEDMVDGRFTLNNDDTSSSGPQRRRGASSNARTSTSRREPGREESPRRGAAEAPKGPTVRRGPARGNSRTRF